MYNFLVLPILNESYIGNEYTFMIVVNAFYVKSVTWFIDHVEHGKKNQMINI